MRDASLVGRSQKRQDSAAQWTRATHLQQIQDGGMPKERKTSKVAASVGTLRQTHARARAHTHTHTHRFARSQCIKASVSGGAWVGNRRDSPWFGCAGCAGCSRSLVVIPGTVATARNGPTEESCQRCASTTPSQTNPSLSTSANSALRCLDPLARPKPALLRNGVPCSLGCTRIP